MSDYHKLLASEDAGAREGYDFDPRVAYHTQSTVLREHLQTMGGTTGRELDDPQRYSGIPEGSHTDSNMLQSAPKMVSSKKYVIVDAAQRDWTQYPNPYSNLTFVFGGQGDTRKPTPVYFNNKTYPSFALPPTNSPGFTPTPGASNVRGFSYIDSNTGVQNELPPYNPSLPRGNFVGYDTPTEAFSSGDYFGTPATPSNVSSIRLVRAILPQTPFFSYPTDPIFNSSASEAKTTTTATPYNTFGTYPYLLFYLNEYRGQYYAPTEAGQKAFAVLTQCNRMQINFALTNGPQYFDYKPWNDEALEFQSPIASLQKLVVSVTDPHGVPFGINQLDNMSVDSIRLASSVDISGRINVSRSTLICITPAYQTYPQVQMRVGDRVSFYTPTLKLLEKSDAISRNNDKKSFIGELTGTTLPVLEVATYKLDPRTNTYVVSSNTITSTDSRVDYFNVFFIPNFTTLQANGSLVDKYPGAVDLPDYSILDIQGILGPGTKLPFLNVTQQPIYTFEMVVKTPDTAAIGGTVVN
jgi:hypothetical protein